MTATTIALAALLAAVTACAPGGASGDDDAAAVAPAWRLTYQLSGGIAGFDVTFEVEAGGAVRYQRRRPSPLTRSLTLPPDQADELARLVRSSGFLELPERIEPKGQVSDAFTYSIRWEEGESSGRRVHEVIASDGTVLPAPFVAVREAVAALERQALGRGEGLQ